MAVYAYFFNDNQDGHKEQKAQQYPNGTLVVLLVYLQVATIGKEHCDDKRNDEENDKNPLAATKHNFDTFSAKIIIELRYMKRKLAAVRAFHEAFGLGIEEQPTVALGEAKTYCATN